MTFPQDSADLAEGGRMPLLGFGTWQIKGSKATSAVGWALDAGYRHLDTATVYGNQKAVAAGLAARPARGTDGRVVRSAEAATTVRMAATRAPAVLSLEVLCMPGR